SIGAFFNMIRYKKEFKQSLVEMHNQRPLKSACSIFFSALSRCLIKLLYFSFISKFNLEVD
ncbi:hypothetical protein KIJ10_01030, partial [Leuconostoc gelidum subsp. gasicomitatum]|uniref:hypothetical protein n=1 Tax=Leuconostoc gasicomitatum TaxID=115778 RepID=UPI001CC487C6